MIWKRWPYWLRGGVIGGAFTLVIFALERLCEPANLYNFPWWERYLWWQGQPLCSHLLHVELIASLLILPVFPLAIKFIGPGNLPHAVGFILVDMPSVAFWFVVGAVIGGTIRYAKSTRNRASTPQ